MIRSYYDTTWTILTADHQHQIVAIDVRLYGNWRGTGEHPEGPFDLDVKAIFRKHGEKVEHDLPDDFHQLAIEHFESNPTLFEGWADEVAADIDQNNEETIDEARAESRED